MRFSEKQIKIYSLFFFLLIYFAFYLYKVTKYDLFYYKHDMFSVLCASRSWIFGHSFLWDNRYGFIPAVHFSFIIPLLSPFTILFGGKGLFIVHVLIYFIAFYFGLHQISGAEIFKKKLFVLFVFFLSPYAFWLFDDTLYGWHLELLLLPFSLFFAIALISEKRWLVFACALLLILTKEDGSVIACCIQLLFILSQNYSRKVRWKKIIKTTSMWLCIFIFSMLVIKFFNHFEESRLESVFINFRSNQPFYNFAYFEKIIGQFILLMLPFFAFCFLVLRARNFLNLFLCIMPVILTGIVSGLYYAADNEWYSLAWAPRIAGIMGVMIAGTFIFINQQKPSGSFFDSKLIAVIGIAGIILLQIYSVIKVRDYNLFTEIKKAYTYTLPENVTPAEAYIMKCIANKTPYEFTVAVPYQYFNLFDKNDFAWFDHPENASQKNPDLIILDDSSQFNKYKFNYEMYRMEKKRKFYLLVRNDKLFSFKECE